MKEAKYGRTRHIIEDVETGARKEYKSINEAKRASRKHQLDHDGALGRGSVRVAH